MSNIYNDYASIYGSALNQYTAAQSSSSFGLSPAEGYILSSNRSGLIVAAAPPAQVVAEEFAWLKKRVEDILWH